MHPTDTESDRLDDDVVEELMSSGREVVLGFASLDPEMLPDRTFELPKDQRPI